MFYTKYRPQRFSELIGLDAVRSTLLNSLSKRRVGHAYLFAGPRGTGKTTTARLLAKALNCKEVDSSNWNGEPCGKCDSCKAIEEGRFLDLIEIDAASNRGIDDIRELREKIRLSPLRGRKKVYVIDEAHMLTREAFNALLKTLEEPPSHAVFILCTTEPEKIPETIRSRCQIFNFRRASTGDIAKKLESICAREGEELSAPEIEKIAKAAQGGFRDAETILEQVLVGGKSVSELLGSGEKAGIRDLVNWIIGNDRKKALTFINHFFEDGGDLARFNRSLLEYLRDLLLIAAGVGKELVEASREEFTEMQRQATTLGTRRIRELINEFTQSQQALPHSPIATLPLELAIIAICTASTSPEPEEELPSVDRPAQKQVESDCPDGIHCGELDLIRNRWNQVLRAVRKYNHSLEALLRSVEPKSFRKGTLTLTAFYSFHRERLSQARNCLLVERAITEVLNIPVRVRCVLGKPRPRSGRVIESVGEEKPLGKPEPVEIKEGTLEEEAVDIFGSDLI